MKEQRRWEYQGGREEEKPRPETPRHREGRMGVKSGGRGRQEQREVTDTA